MANLITYNYFRGTLSLPQTANSQGQALLTQVIAQHETKFLEKALGYELAHGLLDNIGSNADKWKNLRDGVVFTGGNGRVTEWIGFKDETTYLSPIANYVYYQTLNDGIIDLATIGAVTPKGENADRTYPMLKQVKAWNDMVDHLRILHDYLRLNRTTYPEFDGYRPCGITKKINQFGI